jgi:uncharacterized protein YkwD
MRTLKTSLSALSAAVFLVACGGGGSGSASAPVVPAVPAPVAAPAAPVTAPVVVAPVVVAPVVTAPAGSTIQTQVAAATYAVGTESRNAYDFLNSQRMKCGFGLVQQDARLDAAAQAHSDYLMNNNLQVTHYEDKAAYPNGFTGITPTDRVSYAGYPATATTGSEVISEPNSTYGSTFGQAYHGYAMLRGDRDLGIGFSKNAFRSPMELVFGSTTQRPDQLMAASEVKTYPCDGVSGVLSKSYFAENPSPITGRNLQADPIGHPIYVKVAQGNTLVLSSYEMHKVGTAESLALQLLDKSHDPAGLISDNSSATLIPLSPLEKSATYTYTAAGTNNGVIFSASGTFSTGAF